MKLPFRKNILALVGILSVLLGLFAYVAITSGPFAKRAVSVQKVEIRSITPSLFGIGTVQARYTYKIGPTLAGRVKSLNVEVGDLVQRGNLLGEMEPVDLDDRIQAQQAALNSAEASLIEFQAKKDYAATQVLRYEQLWKEQGISEEILSMRRHELAIAEASFNASKGTLFRLAAELEALRAQRRNLKLLAPVDGLITLRETEPGSTVVAGQSVIEMIDPSTLWIEARLDQISSQGLEAGLPANIELRSRKGTLYSGFVLRVEPMADAITEESLAKISFKKPITPLPALGELAEVTILLNELEPLPTIPNAAIQKIKGELGVWKFLENRVAWTPVTLGRSDLAGWVQVLDGLTAGDQIVVYSEQKLSSQSRVYQVDQFKGEK